MSYKHLKEIETLDKKDIYYFTKNDDHKFINTVSEINSRLKYKPASKNDYKKTIVHWGQRKLFISELEFLIRYYPKDFDFTKKKLYILYIGSAKGTHLLYLCKLFPEFNFILVDPAHFDTRLNYLDNVKIINKYFEDSDLEEYSDKEKYENLIFISDIRYPNLSENDLDKQQDYVKIDMDLQKKWYLKLNPYKALLKFRLPWNKDKCEYLDGQLYLQCWAGRQSTETRLVPNGKMKIYDNNKYEQKMYYFNKVIRRKVYGKKTKIVFNSCGHCYDCYKEFVTFYSYCKLKNIKLENFKINEMSHKLSSCLGYNNKF